MVARVVWDDEAAGSNPVSPTIWFMIDECGYSIMVNVPAFQAGDRGSIPLTRSKNIWRLW